MKFSSSLALRLFPAALAFVFSILPAAAQDKTPAAPTPQAPAPQAPASQAPATPAPASQAPAAAQASAAPAGAPISFPVTVVDGKGNPVKNLTAGDLTLTDSGQPQKIQSFSLDPSTHITFGILGQTSTSLRTELGDERLASVHFVDHTLPGTDDRAFVIQFAREVDLLEDPTATVNKLHDAINQLGSPQFGSQNSGGDSSDQSNSGERHLGGGSGGTLYDAIYLASTEVMKKEQGRRILVLITDGIDRGSKETMNDAIEAAQNARTAIFAIYYKGEEEQNNPTQNGGRRGGMGGNFPGGGGYPGGGGGYPGGSGGGRRGGQGPSQEPHVDGKANLEHICGATGGYMIEGKKDKADDAYSKLIALLKTQYTLSYTPSKEASDSAYHRLVLTTNKKDVYPLVQQGFTAE